MRLRLSNQAITILMDHATEGYEMEYKQEVGGDLLGFDDGYDFCVDEAVPYDTTMTDSCNT